MGSYAHRTCRPWQRGRRLLLFDHRGYSVSPNDIETYLRSEPTFVFAACLESDPSPLSGRYPPHSNSIVIAADGACRGNGTRHATAAYGVFVGPDSEYNRSNIIRERRTGTSQRAELVAALEALNQAFLIKQENAVADLDQVVIKMDSEYVVRGMTEWIWTWKRNGFRTSGGKEIANALLFQNVDHLVKELNEMHVEVLFWHVNRGLNSEADGLANEALDAA